jgi:hypothetical protein
MRLHLRLAIGFCLLLACAAPVFAQTFLWRTNLKAPVVGSPVVGGDGVTYLACEDSRVRAYDSRGNPTWTFVLNDRVDGQMALQSGILYVPTRASAIEAVGTNGHRAWEYRVSAHIVGAPAIASGGDILCTTMDDYLHCITVEGRLRWKALLPGTINQGPIIGQDGTVFVGCQDALLAYHLGGQRLWKFVYQGNLEAPLAAGPTGHLLALGNDGKLRCISPDGTLAWLYDIKAGTLPPLVTPDNVYIASDTVVLSLLLDTGELEWEQTLVASGCPALGEDGILYVPSKGSGTSAFDESAYQDSGSGETAGRVAAAAGIYTISGSVLGASTVSVALTGASTASATTDSNGLYSFPNLDSGTYLVTPTKVGYTFNPQNATVIVSNTDVPNQNFTATPGATYSISGTITTGGSGLLGVKVTTTGATTLTDSAGAYTLSGLANGTYTVKPTKAGYNFSPVTLSVSINNANVTGQDFSSAPTSGNIKLLDTLDGGTPLPTSLDIRASARDLALLPMGAASRLVVLNNYPKLYCFEVAVGPLAGSWSQAGSGPRRQSRMDTPPEVTLLGLESGETVHGEVYVEAEISDSDLASITVHFYVNGALAATVSNPPFSFTWHTEGTPDGDATVTAEAVDLGGNSASDSVDVVVENGSPAPLTFYTDDPPQAFTWEAPAGETRFKVQCSADSTFQKYLATSSQDKGGWLRTTAWTPSTQSWKGVLSVAAGVVGEDATGYWRVIGKTTSSFYNGTYKVMAQADAQPSGPPDGSSVPAASPPTFTWIANHNAMFRLEFTDSEDFSSGVKMDSSTSENPWLKGGSWKPSKNQWKKIVAVGQTVTWRVKAKDSVGRITDTSPVYSFVVE